LREDNGRVNPLGLYDLSRNIRPVGTAYKKLIDQWKHIPFLPNGPLTLVGHWEEAWEEEPSKRVPDSEDAGPHTAQAPTATAQS
jgi:hypothetical protein